MHLPCSSLLFLLLIALGCTNPKPPKALPEQKPQKVNFEFSTLQQELGDCDVSEEFCSRVDMKFPLLKNGPKEIMQQINQQIYGVLIQTLAFEELSETPTKALLETMADSFLLEWQSTRETEMMGETAVGWFVKVDGESGLLTGKTASLSLSINSYAGGAHPNSFIYLFNFNLKNGRLLQWQDLFTDVEALKTIAEKKFRTTRDIAETVNLNEAGFFWDESFALPQNFELQLDGILFWYNPYEAASYAEGPTDFIISYDELKDIFRKEVVF